MKVDDIEKLTTESIEYCNSIRGKNYSGCGSDYEFCRMCRTNANTAEQLDRNNKEINEYARSKRIKQE